MADQLYDILVIGGGINGAGIAADAAGRGLNVLLAEAEDLASGTSSASSKLIHGGLRYLEHYEFRLVREALGERERLLAKAPHLIWPLRFILPHVPSMRPDIALRAGLFLYDHLAPRKQLGASSAIDLRSDPAGAVLRPEFSRGYSYYDCWVDDARLVVANALAAAERGADIQTRAPVTRLTVTGERWVARLRTGAGARDVGAKAVVNAAGPWVSGVAGLVQAREAAAPKLRLVKGSHIVVPRLSQTADAYIFQNDDGRVVFALPYETDFTLIGTTDVPYEGDARAVSVSAEEEDYLIAVARRFFVRPPGRADIVWRFSGVRPLEDDGSESASAVSRDYNIEFDAAAGPPLLHVIGGKVTTYRRLAEAALEVLGPHLLNRAAPWTATTPLPGGDIGEAGFEVWFAGLARQYPGFSENELRRLARRYGARLHLLIGGARSSGDLGEDLGAGLTAAEVRFLRDHEWARTADDVLWRRTKAGLHVMPAARPGLAQRVKDVLEGA